MGIEPNSYSRDVVEIANDKCKDRPKWRRCSSKVLPDHILIADGFPCGLHKCSHVLSVGRLYGRRACPGRTRLDSNDSFQDVQLLTAPTNRCIFPDARSEETCLLFCAPLIPGLAATSSEKKRKSPRTPSVDLQLPCRNWLKAVFRTEAQPRWLDMSRQSTISDLRSAFLAWNSRALAAAKEMPIASAVSRVEPYCN